MSRKIVQWPCQLSTGSKLNLSSIGSWIDESSSLGSSLDIVYCLSRNRVKIQEVARGFGQKVRTITTRMTRVGDEPQLKMLKYCIVFGFKSLRILLVWDCDMSCVSACGKCSLQVVLVLPGHGDEALQVVQYQQHVHCHGYQRQPKEMTTWLICR